MELKKLTNHSEKSARFDEAIKSLRERYQPLVWKERADPNSLLSEGKYELFEKWFSIEEYGKQDDWKDGFNCGMLACVEYLAAYVHNWGKRSTRVDGTFIDGRGLAETLFPDFNVEPSDLIKGYDPKKILKMSVGEDGILSIGRGE